MIKINKDFMAGALLGFGAGLVTRSLPKVDENKIRDNAKAALKWALVSAETLKTQLVQLKETVQDITAEARAEVDSSTAEAMTETPEEISDAKPKTRTPRAIRKAKE